MFFCSVFILLLYFLLLCSFILNICLYPSSGLLYLCSSLVLPLLYILYFFHYLVFGLCILSLCSSLYILFSSFFCTCRVQYPLWTTNTTSFDSSHIYAHPSELLQLPNTSYPQSRNIYNSINACQLKQIPLDWSRLL